MKTIEEKCKEGIHEVLHFVELQEGGSEDFAFGNCYYCHSVVFITNKYRHINNGVYELIPPKINAKECRE